jgi:hypothetical protein
VEIWPPSRTWLRDQKQQTKFATELQRHFVC